MNDILAEKSSILHLDELTKMLISLSIAEVLLESDIQEKIVNLLGITAKLKSELLVTQLSNNKKKYAQLKAIIPNVRVAVHAIHKNSNKILVKRLRSDIEYSICKVGKEPRSRRRVGVV